MFKEKDNSLIESLKNRISELEKQLVEVANDNGSIIIKQLPDGQVELNGVKIDNETPVEYYNSAKATYGELTMFRIGKESVNRQMDKLIQSHLDECDTYKNKINELNDEIERQNIEINNLNSEINDLEIESSQRLNQIHQLIDEKSKILNTHELEIKSITERYENAIKLLNEDIKSWQQRYLELNNVKADGTIITKYGKILN